MYFVESLCSFNYKFYFIMQLFTKQNTSDKLKTASLLMSLGEDIPQPGIRILAAKLLLDVSMEQVSIISNQSNNEGLFECDWATLMA